MINGQLSRTNRLCQFIFSAKSGTRFNPGAAELFVKYFYLECQVGPTCYISLISIKIIAKVNLNFSNYCIALLLNVRQDLLLLFQFYEPMPGTSLPHIIDILIIG